MSTYLKHQLRVPKVIYNVTVKTLKFVGGIERVFPSTKMSMQLLIRARPGFSNGALVKFRFERRPVLTKNTMVFKLAKIIFPMF
jgi:hypothetical protein